MKSTEEILISLNERKEKYLNDRAKKRRAAMRIALSIVCFCIIAAGILALPGDFLSPGITHDTDTFTAGESGDINIETVNTGEAVEHYDASWIAAIHYNGGVYHAISYGKATAGNELGRVEYDIKQYLMREDEIPENAISSTSVGVGEAIYECVGYSSEYRICAYSFGRYEIYERTRLSAQDGLELSEILPEPSAVISIDICDNQPEKIGEITEKTTAEMIMELIREGGEFAEYEVDFENKSPLFIYINYADGSRTQMSLYPDGCANILGKIKIPDTLTAIITENIYVDSEDNIKRGGLFFGSDFWHEGSTHYSIISTLINDGELRMGDNGLLATDALKDINRDKCDIWYLDTTGSVTYLRFEFTDVNLHSRIRKGEDISLYIEGPQTVLEGDFNALRVVKGIIWTTDDSGNLYRNGERVAENVNCISAYSRGIAYGRNDGLWHMSLDGSNAEKYAEGDIRAVSCGDVCIYYSTDREVRRIRVDGENDENMLSFGAISLSCCSTPFYGSGAASSLAIVEAGGDCHLLVGERLYSVSTGVEFFEVDGDEAVIVREGAAEFMHISVDPRLSSVELWE